MNAKDIKKGLVVCAGDDCDGCQYYKFHNCYDKLKLDARELIVEQEKEINQLKTECTLLDDELRNARQETINVLNELKAKSQQQETQLKSAEQALNDANSLLQQYVQEQSRTQNRLRKQRNLAWFLLGGFVIYRLADGI